MQLVPIEFCVLDGFLTVPLDHTNVMSLWESHSEQTAPHASYQDSQNQRQGPSTAPSTWGQAKRVVGRTSASSPATRLRRRVALT